MIERSEALSARLERTHITLPAASKPSAAAADPSTQGATRRMHVSWR